MKTLIALMAAGTALVALPSVSQAVCIGTGVADRTTVHSTGNVQIFVRPSDPPGAPLYAFASLPPNAIGGNVIASAAIAAGADHILVKVIGNAVTCPAPIGNIINGGNIQSIVFFP